MNQSNSMTRKLSLDVPFYGSHESETFSGGISKSNVFKDRYTKLH